MADAPPLSWVQARLLLRETLENYKDESSSPKSLKFSIGVGVLVEGVLIVLGVSLLDGTERGVAVFMGVLLFLSIYARLSLRLSPRETAPSVIQKFLQETKEYSQLEPNEKVEGNSISGTALTGIYQVFRTRSDGKGDWASLPGLLLVEGDWVALQVGDITPSAVVDQQGTQFPRGQVLQSTDIPLPVGRITLPQGSPHLLTLQHQMRICRVTKSPMTEFLSERPIRKPTTSVVRRQVLAIGRLCRYISYLLMILCLVLQWGRPAGRYSQYAHVFGLVGLMWVGGPFLLWIIHQVGTRRIMNTLKGLNVIVMPSVDILERLGNATVLSLIDDELACEPDAIPQQLLIPSAQGWQLLDLCPEADSGSENSSVRSDSLDSDDDEHNVVNVAHRFVKFGARRRRRRKRRRSQQDDSSTESDDDSSLDVQFEDPNWWQYLPSLKCIGLSCLLVDDHDAFPDITEGDDAQSRLTHQICAQRLDHQLKALAECIGFSTDPNSNGPRGDLSTFVQCIRLHVVSHRAYEERIHLDLHERSSSQSRWWGKIRPDTTSVVVRDQRSQALQMLTVGDPDTLVGLCSEAWQGEISTILPLSSEDRRTILETSENWKLADLDVTAFGYAPVPQTLEKRLEGDDKVRTQTYLLDNGTEHLAILKDKNVSEEWSIIRNQIFLGILGALVVPRREINKLLKVTNDAGIRFVYFSPRNMRRQKELASQMGIDVAWNCAISLRPLESGIQDPHRMTSQYADWVVNSRLPNGIESVRKHLKEVDNVPLLVSLFTDVTKTSTQEMVDIFQEYNDSVIVVGLSHLPWNDRIFSAADIGIGIDIVMESYDEVEIRHQVQMRTQAAPSVLPAEVELCSGIATRACALRFSGGSALSIIPNIIDESRASLEAASAASVLFVTGVISFGLFVVLSFCTPSSTIPYIPTVGSSLYLVIVLPLLSLSVTMATSDERTMTRVPPKNDPSLVFPGRNEGFRLGQMILLKAIPPALLPQFLHMACFGELVLVADPVVSDICNGNGWFEIIRCDALQGYSGDALVSSGIIVFSSFVICNLFGSVSLAKRLDDVVTSPPWRGNPTFKWTLLGISLGTLLFGWLGLASNQRTLGDLPWYIYALIFVFPVCSLVWNELWKRNHAVHARRAENLRRLQFETRLGAWSPR